MILEAKHISFRYGKETRQILNDFSLKLSQEERLGLIAPSGFGKTGCRGNSAGWPSGFGL